MKKWIVMLMLLVACAARADDEATRQAIFAETTREVDLGGQVLLFCNTDELCQNAMARLQTFTQSLLAGTPGTTNAVQIEESLGRVDGFLDNLGLRAVRGVAYSAVPRADGLNNLKLFVNRTPATGALWRVVGLVPRPLKGLGLLPRDTVLANVQNVDLPAAWQLVRSGVRQIGGLPALAAMDQQLEAVKTNSGVNVAALLGALGDELLVSIQFSSVSNVMVTAGGQLQVYPRPSALIGLALRDAATVRQQCAVLAQSGLLRPLPPVGGAPAYAMAQLASQNAPFPLAPVFVVRDDYLLLATQPDVVSAACAAALTGHGLTATPAFQQAFAGLPTAALNGLIYLHPNFGKTLQQFQASVVGAAQGAPQGNAAPRALMELFPAGQLALVRVAKPNGMALQAVASFGGRDTLASMAVMPVAVMAAVALPAFTQARQTATRAACLNNVRQMDMAKEQWAIDKDKHTGDVPTANDLAPYLKNPLVCPLGGRYTIGPVGRPPRCSLPEHTPAPPAVQKRKTPSTE